MFHVSVGLFYYRSRGNVISWIIYNLTVIMAIKKFIFCHIDSLTTLSDTYATLMKCLLLTLFYEVWLRSIVICLIWIIFGVLHDGHQGQPGLLSSGDDLVGRQEETIAASVSQLKGVGVLDALFIGPVNSDSISLI